MTKLSWSTVRRGAAVAAALLSLAPGARAQTLSGSIAVDNQFTAYLGTSQTVQGTPLVSGSDWQTTYNFGPVALTPGQNYWLQIAATDVGAPGMFIGSFSLAGSGFQFANAGQTLVTNTAAWGMSTTGFGVGEIAPTSYGTNAASPGPWGMRPGIDGSAQFLWTSSQCAQTPCTRYFTTAITATGPVSSVPEPSTWALLGTGLLTLGGIARRRRDAAR
jgi:hypothetical protein